MTLGMGNNRIWRRDKCGREGRWFIGAKEWSWFWVRDSKFMISAWHHLSSTKNELNIELVCKALYWIWTIGLLWVILAENSPNSRPASPNFSTCSSTASTVIPNNYKRLVPPGGCGAEHSCSADYIECCSSAMAAADSHHGSNGVDLCSGGGDQAAAVTPGNGGGGGAVMMVQAAVIIGPKDANINYGTQVVLLQQLQHLLLLLPQHVPQATRSPNHTFYVFVVFWNDKSLTKFRRSLFLLLVRP